MEQLWCVRQSIKDHHSIIAFNSINNVSPPLPAGGRLGSGYVQGAAILVPVGLGALGYITHHRQQGKIVKKLKISTLLKAYLCLQFGSVHPSFSL